MKTLNLYILRRNLQRKAYALSISGIIFCSAHVGLVASVLWHSSNTFVEDSKLIVQAVWSSIAIIFFSLLLYGTKKQKPNFLIPYLCFHLISFLAITLQFIRYLSVKICEDDDDAIWNILIGVIAQTILTCSWLSIYSFYTQMKREKKTTSIYKLLFDQQSLVKSDIVKV